MAEYSPFRGDPLMPHPVTACDGCTACADCEGCYCGEAEDEPTHLLAAS